MKSMKLNLDLIKNRRKELGYQQNHMAEFLGLTNSSMYGKRENGYYRFKAEEIMMLSKVLDVPVDELFLSPTYSKKEYDMNEHIC